MGDKEMVMNAFEFLEEQQRQWSSISDRSFTVFNSWPVTMVKRVMDFAESYAEYRIKELKVGEK